MSVVVMKIFVRYKWGFKASKKSMVYKTEEVAFAFVLNVRCVNIKKMCGVFISDICI